MNQPDDRSGVGPENPFERGEDGVWRARVRGRGRAVLADPLLNKGTGFPEDERRAFGLEGLLSSGQRTLELQAENAAARVAAIDRPLDRYVQLAALQERNEAPEASQSQADDRPIAPTLDPSEVRGPTAVTIRGRWRDVVD